MPRAAVLPLSGMNGKLRDGRGGLEELCAVLIHISVLC